MKSTQRWQRKTPDRSPQIQLSDLIEARKQNYLFRLTEKLRDRTMFLNNKKIPCVPSIFYENDFVIDLQEKAENFNDFFAKQCAVVPNSSKLPGVFSSKTDKQLKHFMKMKGRKSYS